MKKLRRKILVIGLQIFSFVFFLTRSYLASGIASSSSCEAVFNALMEFVGGVRARMHQFSLSQTFNRVQVSPASWPLKLRNLDFLYVVPYVDAHYLAWIRNQHWQMVCKARCNLEERPLYTSKRKVSLISMTVSLVGKTVSQNRILNAS